MKISLSEFRLLKKKKLKNEEKIKFLIEENNTLSSNLKLLNQKKEMLEK